MFGLFFDDIDHVIDGDSPDQLIMLIHHGCRNKVIISKGIGNPLLIIQAIENHRILQRMLKCGILNRCRDKLLNG